jgi:hypothetical protein
LVWCPSNEGAPSPRCCRDINDRGLRALLQMTQTCDAAWTLFNLEGQRCTPRRKVRYRADCVGRASRAGTAAGRPWKVFVRKRRLARLVPQCRGGHSCSALMRFPCVGAGRAGLWLALSAEFRAVSRVAAASRVSWTTVRCVTADNVVMDCGVDLRRVRYLTPVRSPGSGRALVECFHGPGHRGNLGHQGTRPPAMGNNGSGYYRAQQPDKRAEDLPPC